MDIVDFLNKYDILWFPVNLEIVDGKKTLKYTKNYMPSSTDFKELSNDTLRLRQQYRNDFKHIAIDTSQYYHIDFDTQDYPLVQEGVCSKAPYFLSASKKLPHVFIKPTQTIDKKRIQTIYTGIELLTGQWSYANINTKVHNAEIEIQNVDIDKLVHTEQKSKLDNHTFYDGHSPENIKQILDIIAIKYIDDFDSWRAIGSGLYNTGYEFETFDNFSRRGSSYGGTKKLWDSFEKSPMEQIGFGTICYYAKLSDSVKWYKTIDIITDAQKSELDKFLTSGHFTHHTVARIFYEKYRDTYVYAQGSWYELNEGGIFVELCKDAVTIISKTIKDYVQQFIMNAVQHEQDGEKRKLLWKANANLESNGFKKSCVDEAQQEFLDRYLIDNLDTNTKLIGFKNGVYDLQEGCFRTGTTQDRISKTTKIEYKQNASEENIQFLESLFDSYFESSETSYYFKKHLGSLLEGGNPEEKTYFWVGNGRNGKGTTDQLLRETLGDYYAEFSNEYFTIAEKDKSRAKPEILRLRNKRVTMTFEPEGSQKYLTSKFKSLCGGDPLTARDLFAKANEMITFDPTFKPIVQTNHLPQFTEIDDGLLQRLIVIRFPYKYLDPNNYDPANKFHRKIDFALKDKLKKLKSDFFHFLVKYYNLYKLEGLDPSDDIKHEINVYRKDIDSVKTFCEEALIRTDNDKDRISTAEMLFKHNGWSPAKLDKQKFASRLGSIGIIQKQRQIQSIGKVMCVSGYKYNTDFLAEQEQSLQFADI